MCVVNKATHSIATLRPGRKLLTTDVIRNVTEDTWNEDRVTLRKYSLWKQLLRILWYYNAVRRVGYSWDTFSSDRWKFRTRIIRWAFLSPERVCQSRNLWCFESKRITAKTLQVKSRDRGWIDQCAPKSHRRGFPPRRSGVCIGCVRKCSCSSSSRASGGEVRRGRHPPSESISCSAVSTSLSFRTQVLVSFHFSHYRSFALVCDRDRWSCRETNVLAPGIDIFKYRRLEKTLFLSTMAISLGFIFRCAY